MADGLVEHEATSKEITNMWMIFVDILSICALVWLFNGEPDNWDHLNHIMETHGLQEITSQGPSDDNGKKTEYRNFGIGSYRLDSDVE